MFQRAAEQFVLRQAGNLDEPWRDVPQAKVRIDLPQPIAGVLFELIEKKVREFLLPLEIDLRDHAHLHEPAEV